jgi:hypothetical protein
MYAVKATADKDAAAQRDSMSRPGYEQIVISYSKTVCPLTWGSAAVCLSAEMIGYYSIGLRLRVYFLVLIIVVLVLLRSYYSSL